MLDFGETWRENKEYVAEARNTGTIDLIKVFGQGEYEAISQRPKTQLIQMSHQDILMMKSMSKRLLIRSGTFTHVARTRHRQDPRLATDEKARHRQDPRLATGEKARAMG